MRTELLGKDEIKAENVEWWEVRIGTNNESGEPTVLMYFKTFNGEERIYALHQDAPVVFMAALGSCINQIIHMNAEKTGLTSKEPES